MNPMLSCLTRPGFAQAFNTPTKWNFTFFAPSDAAFENTGQYFSTFAATPKGRWWLGNLLQHHYVPNTALQLSSFNSTPLRFQTGSFLYVGAHIENGQLRLNNASTVTEAGIQVTNVSPKYKRVGSRTNKSLAGYHSPSRSLFRPIGPGL